MSAIKKVEYASYEQLTVKGYPVYAYDYTGNKHLIAVVTNQAGQRQVALAFASWHNVAAEEHVDAPE